MIFEHRSYRDFLKDVLVRRKKNNARYSLRAMAASLGFSSSQLSETMNGKANFSARSMIKIARNLKLNSRERDYLFALGDFESCKDPLLREEILNKLERLNPKKVSFTDLTVDQFNQIADWRHSAILELSELNDFKLNYASAATKLRISKPEAELIIKRLVRLKILRITASGDYVRQAEALQIRSLEKSAALRNMYREMFQQASTALDEQSPDLRWSGYETIPLAKEAMPEIRQACDRFFDEVLTIANKYPNKTEIYHLFTHFFSLLPQEKKP